jgi:hypothetical protein
MAAPKRAPVSAIENHELHSLFTKDGPFPFEFALQTEQPGYSVEHIELTLLSLHGRRIALITAYGTTNTSGWSHARLQPYIYVQPPQDGIWDFVFVARPPEGIALDVISPISATYVWTSADVNFQGARVHTATNTLEKKLQKDQKTIQVTPKYRIGDKAA